MRRPNSWLELALGSSSESPEPSQRLGDASPSRPGGENGEPSATHFQTPDLLRLVERFATGFDAMPELIAGRRDYRVLVRTGYVVSG